ncbi:hypothetical protein OS493_018487 [Desmophyllum pertusum]|uniref:Uncharacterized protein n=1 Tax=Desmophyllum pertusum TaxID=174260 RepID=A0A9X0A0W9_9CNID|nr:hypothetical protein OS493_018487 [Desmophyllum pertusum]
MHQPLHSVQTPHTRRCRKKCQGIAVSLASSLPKISSTGVDQLPGVEQIKNDINNHGIGETKKRNQVFNVNEHGTTISRCKDDGNNVPTMHKTCVLVKECLCPGSLGGLCHL